MKAQENHSLWLLECLFSSGCLVFLYSGQSSHCHELRGIWDFQSTCKPTSCWLLSQFYGYWQQMQDSWIRSKRTLFLITKEVPECHIYLPGFPMPFKVLVVRDGCPSMQWPALRERVSELGASTAMTGSGNKPALRAETLPCLMSPGSPLQTTLRNNLEKRSPGFVFLAYPAKICRDTQGPWWLPVLTGDSTDYKHM